MIIKPLEFCERKFLQAREKFWMQELNTIFPYGINNPIDISGIHDAYQHAKSKSNIPIYSVFHIVKNNCTKRWLATLLLLVMKQCRLILLILFPR